MMKRAALSALVMMLFSMGCDDEGPRCETGAECDTAICGPGGRCQSGENGDPCEASLHCLGACGPSGLCHNGTEGDECISNTDCLYEPSGRGVYDCDAGSCTRVPECRGSATPCGLLSTTQCGLSLGCRLDGDCSGLSTSCFSYFSSFSCGSQDGCFWSFSSDYCSGSSRSCSSYSFSSSCTSQDGCRWDQQCDGTPLSCSSLSPATCETQPGCYLD